MSLKFALTGGIACGKSMAEACFQALGCRVLDADAVVHRLEAYGGKAVQPLRECFGETVLAADGSIDRVRLGQLVFAEPTARQQLESVIHPLIRAEVETWLRQAKADEISVFSAALLYECGWEKGWDGVVCVAASRATQVRRMCSARGMTEAAAEARLAAQMALQEKIRRADWVLENDTDDLSVLRCQVEELVLQWKHLLIESKQ